MVSKYTLFSEPGKVNIFAGAFRRMRWYLVWFLKKLKHRIYTAIRSVLNKTYRHPYLESKRQKRALQDILLNTYSIDDGPTVGSKKDLLLIVRDGRHHPKSSAFIRLIGPLSQPAVKTISIYTYMINPSHHRKLQLDQSVSYKEPYLTL